jgi:hypothetical protein
MKFKQVCFLHINLNLLNFCANIKCVPYLLTIAIRKRGTTPDNVHKILQMLNDRFSYFMISVIS